MPHPSFSATLADQHRDQLGGQVDQLRLLRQSPQGPAVAADRPPLVAAERLASPPLNRPRRPHPVGSPKDLTPSNCSRARPAAGGQRQR